MSTSDSATGSSTGQQSVLVHDDLTTLRDRWTRIEERFVDNPSDTVRQADQLIDDVIDHIRTRLLDRRSTLRDEWHELDDATTEQLRQALHQYEQLFTQLTGIPSPAGWHDEDRVSRPTTHGRPSFPRTGEPPQDTPPERSNNEREHDHE